MAENNCSKIHTEHYWTKSGISNNNTKQFVSTEVSNNICDGKCVR